MTDKDEYLPVPPEDGHPAWVNVMAGFTKNIGDFSSIKVSVSITYPCDPSKVDDVYPRLKDWVDKRVEHEYKEVSESIADNRAEI